MNTVWINPPFTYGTTVVMSDTSDLVSVLALPAIWSGHDASQIASTLLDVLVRILRLDFAYLRVSDSVEDLAGEWAQAARRRDTEPHEIGRALDHALTHETPTASLVLPNPIGEGVVSLALVRLGLGDDLGRFAAASQRTDFPTEIEQLILQVAANQAAMGLLEARYVIKVRRWRASEEDLRREIFERTRAEERFREENLALREEVERASMFEEIVGVSAPLRSVLSLVSKVAATDSTVLITGETGTGKELVARAIHKRSRRAARVFVCVNCAAISRTLIASELFGHENGAFTGAVQRRIGRFELADGGTIFLDEIGELPAETQVALLWALQERQFERVGGGRPIQADVRVIAATNRDLEASIAAGAFRADLFYRLNVFPVEMPSLRDRRDDIPLLVRYFVDRYARDAGKKIKHVSKRSLTLLQSYPWPGNVQELQNVIERSIIVSETDTLTVDERWFLSKPAAANRTRRSLAEQLTNQERTTIETALAETRGRVSGPTGAAAKLRIPPSTLESRIKALRIDKNRFKTVY
jgi:transcriptional regulator with GAF, ATPase, and Fis domain